MKKIISIAFAAILASLAISCQKEISLTEQDTASVQYTFNISVNEQFGFDNNAPTKGGGAEEYKTAWTNGDKIFLFFKPESEALLDDTYATLTYNGSSWDGSVTGSSSLGEGGTLAAVYVYNLGSVTPEYSGSQWTIATGNVFYNCESGVAYSVSGGEISASLKLETPADFVQFCAKGGASNYLTCDKVKGWKDVAIGSDMAVSNVTCTGYMRGSANTGDSNVTEYYGRLVSGTSLQDETCNFSIVKNGIVYEHTAEPTTTARGFTMYVSTPSWTEASEKLPGLFSVAEGKWVRFSKGNLYWNGSAFNFEDNQYDISSTWNTSHVSNFYWSKNDDKTYTVTYDGSGRSDSDVLFTNATAETAKADFTVNGKTGMYRTLSRTEWQYLLANHTFKYVPVNGKYGIVIAPDGYSGTIGDSYDLTAWAEAEAAGLVFLPSTGFRQYNYIAEVSGTISCIYWTSTASTYENAYRMFFQWSGSTLSTDFDTDGERKWAVGIRLVTDVK